MNGMLNIHGTSPAFLQQDVTCRYDMRPETLDLLSIPRLPPRVIPLQPLKFLMLPKLRMIFI